MTTGNPNELCHVDDTYVMGMAGWHQGRGLTHCMTFHKDEDSARRWFVGQMFGPIENDWPTDLMTPEGRAEHIGRYVQLYNDSGIGVFSYELALIRPEVK